MSANVLGEAPMRRIRPYLLIGAGANGNAQLINCVMSVSAAQRVYQEAVAKLRIGEVIRCRDASGTLVLSSDPAE